MKIILLTFLFSTSLFARFEQAPPPFKYKSSQAVFVDFKKAKYQLTYDHKSKQAYADTTILFEAKNSGFPIFDSVIKPTKVLLNGKNVKHELIDVPGGVSKVRIALAIVKKGIHSFRISTPIDNGTVYKRRGVSSGFFIKDLTDRMFLERYVPSNYEYDQYQMTFRVKVVNTKKTHNIFANGNVKTISWNYFEAVFPSYYTASAVYFHLVPIRKFIRLRFKYNSIDGRKIPVVIYSRSRLRNRFYAKKTIKVLKELERDYGPWPHPHLIIYGTKLKGGMEYNGATVTSYISLGHELQHSYFAKGMIPANGNSGWMDEAIASWRDKGHKSSSHVGFNHFNLGNHNIYTRKTDSNSYEKGRAFMAYLDHKLKKMGKAGLKAFLRMYFQKRKYTTVTTKDFIKDLKEYAGESFQKDFDKYVFGKIGSKFDRKPAVEGHNPHHGHMSEADIKSLL
ncbi:MAG: hypothetical protein N4A33_13195 [Bacteriovoracaceae bacterium]|jgi:hypothetical protein|nr:hypothetical protein [Bacteriovoracaceae bacterium]